MLIFKTLLIVTAMTIVFFLSSCGNKFAGTYANANGTIVLDVKSGDRASLTVLGEKKECSYQTNKDELTLTCDDDKTVFNRHEDGSLTGPGMIGQLKKSS